MGKAHKKVSRPGLKSHVAEFARLFNLMVDPYRPELHYMRGPGPKWHAKHAPARSEAPSVGALARIRG